MNFIKKLLKLIFSTFAEPAKEKIKHQLDERAAQTDSKFVKKRNQLEKSAIDLIDEDAVDMMVDTIQKKKK